MRSASRRFTGPHCTHPRSFPLFPGILFLLFFAFAGSVLHAQAPLLLPSIGLSSPPQDTDPICPIPIVAGPSRGYRDVGPEIGAVVADFTLYDIDGNSFTLSEALERKKPVLLINGSYTCPVFREKMPIINEVVRDYGDALTVAIIYTLEAHPLTDTSVYYGYVNTGKPNYDEGVLYRQPRTYGERRQAAADMLAALEISAPVYIDGPCNEWWKVFGPAPNNACLIDTAGRVFAKHGWFHRNPDNIRFDIRRLLGEELPEQDSTNGSFQLFLQSSNIVTGPAGETLYAYAELRNTSAAPVEIGIQRQSVAVPEGWSTALCTDICLDTSVAFTTLVLEPEEQQLFTLYFYSGPASDTALVTVTFRNMNSPQNRYMQNFTGITESATSEVEEREEEKEGNARSGMLSVFPNPAAETATVSVTLEEPAQVRIDLFGPLGRHITTLCAGRPLEGGIHSFDLPSLPSGNYFLRLTAGDKKAFETVRISE